MVLSTVHIISQLFLSDLGGEAAKRRNIMTWWLYQTVMSCPLWTVSKTALSASRRRRGGCSRWHPGVRWEWITDFLLLLIISFDSFFFPFEGGQSKSQHSDDPSNCPSCPSAWFWSPSHQHLSSQSRHWREDSQYSHKAMSSKVILKGHDTSAAWHVFSLPTVLPLNL